MFTTALYQKTGHQRLKQAEACLIGHPKDAVHERDFAKLLLFDRAGG
jgi:hypothetical protein